MFPIFYSQIELPLIWLGLERNIAASIFDVFEASNQNNGISIKQSEYFLKIII